MEAKLRRRGLSQNLFQVKKWCRAIIKFKIKIINKMRWAGRLKHK